MLFCCLDFFSKSSFSKSEITSMCQTAFIQIRGHFIMRALDRVFASVIIMLLNDSERMLNKNGCALLLENRINLFP